MLLLFQLTQPQLEYILKALYVLKIFPLTYVNHTHFITICELSGHIAVIWGQLEFPRAIFFFKKCTYTQMKTLGK